MSWKSIRALVACVPLLLSACVSDIHKVDYTFTLQQVEVAIDNYLNCDECWSHQLHHVVLAGDAAKPLLEALVANPESKLPPGFEASLRAEHAALAGAVAVLTISEDDYYSAHRVARLNLIKARAARALYLIDRGSMSRRELTRIRGIAP